MTSNNISQLPPEFSRAERFDAIMFLDLPDRESKDMIWKMYIESFKLDGTQPLPADAEWTGAEIRSCCRLAATLGDTLQNASQYIVPVGVTAQESIADLRKWASGRCIDATLPGVYRERKQEEPTKRRRVDIDSSRN